MEKKIVHTDLMRVLTMTLFILLNLSVSGQQDRKLIREGNREFNKSKFPESEIIYRKAAQTNKYSPDAVFNTGDALYRQNKFEEAGKQFIETTNMNDDPVKKSAGLYNLGNSLLMANKPAEAIDAYKKSLRLKPDSPEAKYNLAYAQDLLKQQQEQQQQQQQQKDQEDKKDEKEKDQNKQQDDQQQNDDKQQQKQEQQRMSQEDAQRILNSLANDEKNVQEKVKLAKAAKDRVRTVKNW